MTQSGDSVEKVPLWRDERFWRIAIQVLAIVILVIVLSTLLGNLNRNLQQQGRQFNFDFLWNAAGFNIGESIIPYTPNDRYYWALFVGLINTLRLILVGFVLTTLLGVVAGIASFSENWLVRKISFVYVEIVRNTPLLLQLFFWYFAVFFSLSIGGQISQLPGSIFVSKAGIWVPFPPNTLGTWLWVVVLIVGAIAAVFLWKWRTKLIVEQGASGKPQLYALIGMAIAALLILTIGLGWSFPKINAAGQPEGGLRMSLEYAAMLAGLVFYTGAFIAEIVRAGIQSVSKGQWEAARALGLQPGLVMQLVVFPQALRVIIPSLNSQYMNLAKNSSLAVAIGYPDVFASALTTLNQTGRGTECIILIAATYLILNLIISVVMNQVNHLVQLRER